MQSIDFHRSLGKIFTNPTFKTIAQTGSSEYFFNKVKEYEIELCVKNCALIKDVIKKAYHSLSTSYRNEYVYKNTISNKLLLARHNLRTTTMLSEFKVANSIADLVVLNGTSTVYEIKTELDTPAKLKKQVQAYKKAFEKIYLVTHATLTSKYLELVKEEGIGLLSLDKQLQLVTLVEAQSNFPYLENEVMFKCLRKDDYSALLKSYFGYVPQVPNTKYFAECLTMAKEIPRDVFHSLFICQLKKRAVSETTRLNLKSIPKELRHICLCLNPSSKEYHNLINFLNQKL